MSNQGDRLKAAIFQKGYETLEDFAASVGVKGVTLRQQINRGSLPKDSARDYARKLGVPYSWLMFAEGEQPDFIMGNFEPEENVNTLQLESGSEDHILLSGVVREVNVFASAGAGSVVEYEEDTELWAFPEAWVRSELRTAVDNLKIITIRGDSMVSDPPKATDILPGDKVVVDIADRVGSPPGVFVLHDGLGLIAKRLEYIPASDPPTVRVMSNNPAYETRTSTIDEAHCVGRIVAKWQRVS